MDPVKLDEKRKAELVAQLEELKAELKEHEEERSLPGAKPSQLEKLGPLLMEVAKKERAVLLEKYSNYRKPLIVRLNSQQDPAASPPGLVMLPAFSEDGEEKEA
uniref:Uncharacterized protein n=1 Tax=Avena sativa TaxID=4498 RepID=A0ACD5Y4F1_AVESA